MEQSARSPRRTSVKRKEKAAHDGVIRKKSVVAPVSFKLQTELLAERRKQQREEKEVVQLRNVQLKIMGKKTVEDFAQLKLMRRETATARRRSLHCNVKQDKSAKKGGTLKVNDRHTQSLKDVVHLESRPLQSARAPSPRMVLDSLPQRPQSAKPVLQSQHRSTATSDEETDLNSRQSKPLQSKKKRKKKTDSHKSEQLTPSKSAPVLPSKADSPTGKKINIIVNMRNLQLSVGLESPSGGSPPVISREAWTLVS
ncbi:uncharacterized protein KRP23_13417 [Phytophthora ramorum]|uniref:uncharacterized protein n=1 Tax=Phytophthora ramorum TaxID=164328 RepID=UPI003095E6FE|nr:hypothetical protein KRP23_13417 [Phytophthora ramorum]